MRFRNIVNISGGKDSTAVYIEAVARGVEFEAVFADTGHEHPDTYDYVQGLAAQVGGPPIKIVRADFSEWFERRRRFIEIDWFLRGVPSEKIDRALSVMHPTGSPFLDLCLLKARFPSSKVRFCTEFLKADPIEGQVFAPLIREGWTPVSWQGERRAESRRRSALPVFQRVRRSDLGGTILIYRPILTWQDYDTFNVMFLHGVAPNPLYRQGMGRVGCMPCIMAQKGELREIARRFPEEVERIAEWERLVAEVSLRDEATFFSANRTPAGKRMVNSGATAGFPDARYVMREWAFTARGGEAADPEADEDGPACTSQYGLCE